MPMREDCKHFQSRTYASGEVARFCVLDLAPEAPWRCPDTCARYERRIVDVAWTPGSLVRPPVSDADSVELGEGAAALLDQAEDILNTAGPEIVAEIRRQREREASPGVVARLLRRLRRR